PAVLDSTWVSTHGPGVYDVMHSCSGCTDVTIDGSSPANCPAQYSGSYTTCLLGYTFYLENGATMDVTGKTSVLITPYVPAATQNPNDGFFAVYAPPGSSASLTEEKNGTLLAMTGTVYMPSGTVDIVTNAILRIDGQALVNTWNVQSGNHDNPVITFNNQRAATQREVLQLVE